MNVETPLESLSNAAKTVGVVLVWLNTFRRAETNSFSSDIAGEGGGPGSAYPPDWDSRAEPLSAAQMDSVLEVSGIPDSMRARVLRRLRPK